MKKILFYINFIVLTLFSSIGCEEKGNELVGQWGLIEPGNGCPYVLSFDSEGGYTVLNDCYGLDPRNPIVETGQFIFSNGMLGSVEFVNRKLNGGYDFLGSDASNKVFINRLSDLDLIICLMRAEKKTCDEDRLKRLDHQTYTN
jgi:hypothetical protein